MPSHDKRSCNTPYNGLGLGAKKLFVYKGLRRRDRCLWSRRSLVRAQASVVPVWFHQSAHRETDRVTSSPNQDSGLILVSGISPIIVDTSRSTQSKNISRVNFSDHESGAHIQPLIVALVIPFGFIGSVDGGSARLRAILLTSATTVPELVPLIFERSFLAWETFDFHYDQCSAQGSKSERARSCPAPDRFEHQNPRRTDRRPTPTTA